MPSARHGDEDARFDYPATLDGDVGVLTVSGEVDLAAGPALREGLDGLVRGGARHLVVDL